MLIESNNLHSAEFEINAKTEDDYNNLNIPRQISIGDYINYLDGQRGTEGKLVNEIKGEFRLRFTNDPATILKEDTSGDILTFEVYSNNLHVGTITIDKQRELERETNEPEPEPGPEDEEEYEFE